MKPDETEIEEILARERAEGQAEVGAPPAAALPPGAAAGGAPPSRHPPFEEEVGGPPARRERQQRAMPAVGALVDSLAKYLNGRAKRLAEWAGDRVDPAALIRFALLDYARSEQLQRCTPESIYFALIACAQSGLEPGGVKQEAYIVPYRDQAQFQLGWRGVVTLARRSREVAVIDGDVVYEGDDFDHDKGSNAFVRHRTCLGERGEMVGAYAFAKLTNGSTLVEVMTLAQLEQVRKQAARGGRESPAWRDWADQMYRKSPFKRLGKRLPLGVEYRRAVAIDNASEGGDGRAYRDALAASGVDVSELPTPAEAPTPPARGLSGLKEAVKKVAEP